MRKPIKPHNCPMYTLKLLLFLQSISVYSRRTHGVYKFRNGHTNSYASNHFVFINKISCSLNVQNSERSFITIAFLINSRTNQPKKSKQICATSNINNRIFRFYPLLLSHLLSLLFDVFDVAFVQLRRA